MKILVCAGFSPSLVNFRGELLQALVAEGHSVTACGPEDLPQVRQALTKWSVDFLPVPLARTSVNPASDIVSIFRLFSIFRQVQPDVFLGYTVKPVVYGSIAASYAGVPEICSLITGLGYSFMGHSRKQRAVGVLVRALYRKALRKNHLVFFQNSDDLKLFQELGLISPSVRTSVVNGSGVDLGRFARKAPPDLQEGMKFLLIARLISEKGIYEYVEAARALKSSFPNAKFQLLGGFEERPGSIPSREIEDWAKEGVIEYLGEQGDVRPFMEACHVYVLPSYREGAPRTVLEAMAIGRPIVTTNVPGCRQTVIEGKNGFLVPVRESQGLRLAMEKFLHSPGMVGTMGEESRKIAQARYDVRQINRQMLGEMGLLREHRTLDEKPVLEKSL